VSVFIIAEIGINHDGINSKARELIKLAQGSGVHAVKFQYRNLENAYSSQAKEIGDEILSKEINRSYLSPEELLELSIFAKNLNLEVGISFFDEKDILDFGTDIKVFDFFKIPSVELTNSSLINSLMKLNRHVYISLGAHDEKEIELALSQLSSMGCWTPMHCISNYPVNLQNAHLGYIPYLKEKWQRNVGYSSHDDDWEVCLLAMQLGVTVIERHITLDRDGDGLDHSSSSTSGHFEKISRFAHNLPKILSGDSPRIPNQGELLNRQNLGRSYFPIKDFPKGHIFQMSDLVYRSPNTGLNKTDIGKYLSKPIQMELKKREVITHSLFEQVSPISQNIINSAREIGLSLPVRLHDLNNMEGLFPIGAFEFHLSFDEVLSKIDLKNINPLNKYSIHLPDYINPTQLMDPFSNNEVHRRASLNILERTVLLAERLQELTGIKVPVVGSFSVVHHDRTYFFEEHNALLKSYEKQGIKVIPQWLPPIAWYFGGSVNLNVMNELQDADFIRKHNLGVCLDICHMILGRNYFNYSTDLLLDSLGDQVEHVHIADAIGVDGEGLAIGSGDAENLPLIKKSLNYDCIKVIEVWQGHLNNGAGFREALTKLTKLYEK
jgi:sialic acid synthase SpsE/sugar phosphate isomerase/epimerase